MNFAIRKLEEADLRTVMNWRMSESVTRYMNTDPVLTYEGQLKWYRNLQEDNTTRYWIVEVDGTPAGVINLLQIDRKNKTTSRGYYIGEENLRSLKLALSLEMSLYDYCFNLLGLTEVHNEVFELNEGVWKLHLACGCAVERIEKDEVSKNGISYNIVHLSITKEKWNALRKTKKYAQLDFDVYDDALGAMVPHHLGIAVADIQASAAQYSQIGWTMQSGIITDNTRNVALAFFASPHREVVELVAPLQKKSPVTKMLEAAKNVATPYHICYETDDLELAIAALKKRKYILTNPPSPAIAFGGRRVAFLLHKSTGLIELLEREQP